MNTLSLYLQSFILGFKQWMSAEPPIQTTNPRSNLKAWRPPAPTSNEDNLTKKSCQIEAQVKKNNSKPVHVIQVVDVQSNTKHTGRLVISGRMEDVCAELDRLVALEAA